MSRIDAECGLSELIGYATGLRSMTRGRGQFTMEFARYEEIPAHLAQKVAEQASGEPAHA